MRWCFGIVTDGFQSARLNTVIASIINEAPSAQIIVVGGKLEDIDYTDIDYIPFDESKKKAWITRKKNLIAQNARFENICFMHDYVALQNGWLDGFNKFGYNWLTCVNRILNRDGTRFRDWCVLYHDAWMNPPIDDTLPPGEGGRLLRYTTRGHERWQYYSGAYFCAKQHVILRVPFDESLSWGQGEDAKISRLLYKKFGPEVFQFNPHSLVRFVKQKERAPWESMDPL